MVIIFRCETPRGRSRIGPESRARATWCKLDRAFGEIRLSSSRPAREAAVCYSQIRGTSAVIDVQQMTAPSGGSDGGVEGLTGTNDDLNHELTWTPNA
jgi:hypothetical protein